MRLARSVSRWPVLLLMLLVAACASTGTSDTPSGEGAAAGDGATIVIVNDQAGAALLQVYIEPVGGVRANLGRVEPNRTGTFRYNGPTGQYVIVAQNVDAGTSRTSDRFTLRPGRTVTWDMAGGRVTFRDGS